MGRLGGRRDGLRPATPTCCSCTSPTDGADERGGAAGRALAVVQELRRLLGRRRPGPAARAGRRPAARGQERSAGAQLAVLPRPTTRAGRWSGRRQALLRATPIAGDAELGSEFVELIDPLRWPAEGLARHDVREIRTLKARMESERLPRGADPRAHLKLGPRWAGRRGVDRAAAAAAPRATRCPALRTTSHPARRWPRRVDGRPARPTRTPTPSARRGGWPPGCATPRCCGGAARSTGAAQRPARRRRRGPDRRPGAGHAARRWPRTTAGWRDAPGLPSCPTSTSRPRTGNVGAMDGQGATKRDRAQPCRRTHRCSACARSWPSSPATTLSAWGDHLARLTVAAFVLERSGSPLAAATTLAVSLIPSLFGRSLLGPIADRFPYRYVLIAANVVRAALVGVIIVAVAGGWSLAWLLSLLFVLELAGGPAVTSMRILLTDLFEDRRLYTRAIGLNSLVRAGQPGHRARHRRRGRLRRRGHQRPLVRPRDVPLGALVVALTIRTGRWSARRARGSWATSATSSPVGATWPSHRVLAAMLAAQPGDVLGHRGAGGGGPGLRRRGRRRRGTAGC